MDSKKKAGVYMFGSESYPAILFGILLFFVPKTPRYLVLIEQEEKAFSILEKINGTEKGKRDTQRHKKYGTRKNRKVVYLWCSGNHYRYIIIGIPTS